MVAAFGGPGDAGELTRSQKVWFDDGNVVLQADNVQFRAHRSILSKHSVILASILEAPRPDDEATVEGCPVIHLYDAPGDVEAMLLVLYGDPHHVDRKESFRFRAVAATIRLGRKYEIAHLRDEGLAKLKRELPVKLEDYDRRHLERAQGQLRYPGDAVNPEFITINLAHECKIQSILPALYLFSLQRDLDKPLLESDELPIPFPAMRSCLHGRQKLQEAATRKVYVWAQQVGTIEKCRTKTDCQNISRRVMRDLLWYIGRSSRYRPLRTWKDYAAGEAGTKYLKGLCGPCRLYAETTHEEGRKTVWKELPTYFQLPEWQNLKDFYDQQ